MLGQITVAVLKAWHRRVKASAVRVEEEKGERAANGTKKEGRNTAEGDDNRQ